MDQSAYITTLEREAVTLAAAAGRGVAVPTPSCPGWTTGHVIAHVGRAYRWMTDIVATRSQTSLLPDPDKYGHDPCAPDLLEWFDEGLQGFASTFRDVGVSEPVWTWSGDGTAGFWLRLETHETAIHRWDAQLAHGRAEPIEPELARDAIDFALDHFLPSWRLSSVLPGGGESYHLHRTDGEGEWLVRFNPDGLAVSREHAKAAVALRGGASDLLLWLWGRTPADSLEVLGDASLVARWHDLAPV